MQVSSFLHGILIFILFNWIMYIVLSQSVWNFLGSFCARVILKRNLITLLCYFKILHSTCVTVNDSVSWCVDVTIDIFKDTSFSDIFVLYIVYSPLLESNILNRKSRSKENYSRMKDTQINNFGFVSGKFKTELVKEWVKKLTTDRTGSSATWRKLNAEYFIFTKCLGP